MLVGTITDYKGRIMSILQKSLIFYLNDSKKVFNISKNNFPFPLLSA